MWTTQISSRVVQKHSERLSHLALAAYMVFLILVFFFLNPSFCPTTHWGSWASPTQVTIRTSCGLSPWGVPGLCSFLSGR